MSKKFGPLNFNNMKNENSKELTKAIINGVKRLETFTIDTLRKHKDQMELLSDKLLEKETIDYTEIKNVLDNELENTLEVTI